MWDFSWPRAIAVWLGIIVAETVHGILRTALIAPRIGDFRARQAGVFVGALLIFVIACFFVGKLRARSAKSLLGAGLLWLVLTLIFEIGLGRLLGYSWSRILSDYDLRHGGLMPIGLVFMALAPLLATRARERFSAGGRPRSN